MADSKPGVHVLQLKHVSVPPNMVAGEKFIKWDEVRRRFVVCSDRFSGCLYLLLALTCLIAVQDASLVTAVTLRVDPSGYFLYWTDQNEVIK